MKKELRLIKIIFLISVSLLVIRCSDSTTNYNEAVLNQEFNIKVGDSTIITQKGIIVKFKSVEDESRCPEGAVCVWAGNATVVLELKNSDGDTLTSKLNTSIEPKEVNFSNVTLSLKNLVPYPKFGETINPNDYVAKLFVKNKEN